MERQSRIYRMDFINLSIAYRFVSLAVSTLVYLINTPGGLTGSRIMVSIGMAVSCVIGAYVYKKTLLDEEVYGGAIATVCVEVFAYGMFIVLSGGFASPYLWYFAGTLTIVIALKRFKTVYALSIIWGLMCAAAGKLIRYPDSLFSYSDINIMLGFLTVTMSFYTLAHYVHKLNDSRRELEHVNSELHRETVAKEEVLSQMVDLYDTSNLFFITEPDRVLVEFTGMMSRTVSPHGCMVVRLDMDRAIKGIGYTGLSDLHAASLLAKVSALSPGEERKQIAEIYVEDVPYRITYISNLSNFLGVLIIPAREGEGDTRETGQQEQFYCNLLRIILKELSLQEMVEEYIISEEQNRIASEIHDTVLQKLFGMACNLHAICERLYDMTSEELSRRIKEVEKSAESTMKELREAIYGLRWSVEGKDIFVSKLDAYLREVEMLNEIEINLNIDEDVRMLTTNQKTVCYRIACEAVNNAVRHGKASLIDVNVKLDENDVFAMIVDNGAGFSLSEANQDGKGIRNMQRMASLLKGRLSIDSEPGMGTEVRISLPR